MRDYALKTSHGTLRLAALTPRLQQVIHALLDAYPQWRNIQIASFLRFKHGISLTPHAVAYHRWRILRKETRDARTG